MKPSWRSTVNWATNRSQGNIGFAETSDLPAKLVPGINFLRELFHAVSRPLGNQLAAATAADDRKELKMVT